MKIAIVGSRGFFKDKQNEAIDSPNQILIYEILAKTFQENTIYISGGAIGVDSYSEQIINEINLGLKNKILKIIFKPDWNKYGKSAGFKRNKLIVDEADKVIAFWDGQSKGTKHSIDLAIQQNKPVDIYIRN